MEALKVHEPLKPEEPIKVLARISFLSAEDGGRNVPLAPPYRPNHNFGAPDDGEFYIGQISVPVGHLIHPGETHELAITFLNGPGLSEIVQVGRSWRIQEGSRHVATAQVLAVLREG